MREHPVRRPSSAATSQKTLNPQGEVSQVTAGVNDPLGLFARGIARYGAG